jgi:hypothetical protein
MQIAITCPDPVLNSQARQYFTRHMRVLEQCTSSTQPEIQQQINALREAFSRDTSKPFELKQTLGMHSPVMDQHLLASAVPTQPMQQPVVGQNSSGSSWPLSNSEISPKTTNSASEYMQSFDAATASASMPSANVVAFNTSSFDIPSSAAYPTQNFSHVTGTAYQQPYSLERVPSNEQTPPVWDPSGIISQWNTAFGPQPNPPHTSPPTAQYTPASSASILRQPIPQQPVSAGMQASFYQPPAVAAIRPQAQQTSIPGAGYSTMPAVTPNMWQDAFTSAYVSGHGQKRFRDESVDLNGMYDPYGTKRRG